MTHDLHMQGSVRENIYKLLKEEFIVTDSVMDIGYKHLIFLFDFDKTDFSRLYGIEKDNYGWPAYFQLASKENITGILAPSQFRERYELHPNTDFTTFEFKPQTYSLVICRFVLHFYSDSDKLKHIKSFYHSLQENGLLYLRINTIGKENDTDPEFWDSLGDNVYQNKVDGHKRYLVNSEDFINTLKEEYNILDKFTDKNDLETVTIVIKKQVI